GYLVAGALPIPFDRGELLALGLVSAFLTVELIKTFGRAVFAKHHPKLRLWPMSDANAISWYGWLARLVSITGYGLMVAVPLVQYMAAPSVGRLVGLFIMLMMYVYAVRVIWAQRSSVRAAMVRHADAMKTTILGTLVRVFARVWHVLAIVYFTVLLAI